MSDILNSRAKEYHSSVQIDLLVWSQPSEPLPLFVITAIKVESNYRRCNPPPYLPLLSLCHGFTLYDSLSSEFKYIANVFLLSRPTYP